MVKELIEFMVKSIVEKPECVSVQEVKRGEVDCIEIVVDIDDRGKVIGREGQTIKSLRAIASHFVPAEKKILIDLVHS
jgi:predicted RNA-binding protein YlqC (UPF0109 family)